MTTYILDEATVAELWKLIFDDLAYYAEKEDHARGREMEPLAEYYGERVKLCEKFLKIFEKKG